MREILADLDRTLAYTTVATVLDRLHRKGQVVRRKDGAVWRYSPARSREHVVADEVARLVEAGQSAGEPLLVAFLDQVEAVDPAGLDRLEALIRARKEQV